MQQERGHALQLDLDEHAEGAEAQLDGGQQFGMLRLTHPQHLTVCGHECGGRDLGREPAVAEPRAVRARARGPRNRLPVDVAHVLQGEAVRREER